MNLVRTPSKIVEISQTPRDFKTPTTKLNLSLILTQTTTIGNLHSDEDADMENNFKSFNSAWKIVPVKRNIHFKRITSQMIKQYCVETKVNPTFEISLNISTS